MELLETTAQSYEIEKIISESRKYLIIVSPYLQINNRLKPKLDECFNRNIKTLILYRENKLTNFELSWFDQYPNVTLMPIKNLHAKCYLNEGTALITSMNLYDYSQINNHEIGVKLTRDRNENDIEKLHSFINTIIKTDNPQHTIKYYLEYHKTFTMGKLYAELIQGNKFPKTDKMDGQYIFMSDVAKKLNKFEITDFKDDRSTLLRTTILSEELYNAISKEVLKNTIKEKEEIVPITLEDFNTEWHSYLSNSYKNHHFSTVDGSITARDFPVKNVDYSNKYGFASFSFSLNYDFMKKHKEARLHSLYSQFKDYRLYWSPADKINIYYGKQAQFENVQEEIKYCAHGLDMIIKEIQKFT